MAIACNQTGKNEKIITIYDWSKYGSPPPQSDSIDTQRKVGKHYEGEVNRQVSRKDTLFIFE
jgi:hypothetical protein